MTQMTCPQCGAALNIDILTREPRPCTECGTTFSLDSSDRPQPDAEHQQNINRQKYFEIAAVIVMILVGFGYMALSTGKGLKVTSIQNSSSSLSATLTENGYTYTQSIGLRGQQFQTYTQQKGVLQTTVDLISYGDNAHDTIGTFVIAVSIPKGHSFPPDAIIEPAVQEAFNAVITLGEALLPKSTHGLQKAVSTTALMRTGSIKHLKGVAQTSSGWKITYINYREHKESEFDTPLLLFIYQKLSFASNSQYESFHKELYKASGEGQEIKRVMSQGAPQKSIKDPLS